MNTKYLLAPAFAVAMSLTNAAFADVKDYAFEPVVAEMKKGDDVVVAVRLLHKPTGKPVADAVIVRTRVDMAPDGMADMASPVAALPGSRARGLRLQDRSADGGTLPAERGGQGARRAGDRRRQGHLQSCEVTAMTHIRTAFILTLGLAAAAVASYGYFFRSPTSTATLNIASQASAAERTILYYRDPIRRAILVGDAEERRARPRLPARL